MQRLAMLPLPKIRVAKTDAERDAASSLPYLQLLGSSVISHLSTMTRPDISYHIANLCSCMQSPTRNSYQAALEFLSFEMSTQL